MLLTLPVLHVTNERGRNPYQRCWMLLHPRVLLALTQFGGGKIGLRGGGGSWEPPEGGGGGSGNGAPVTEPLVKYQSPRREVDRSSAGLGVVYPPFFGVIHVAYPKAWCNNL